jgi:hypothetical protein
MKARGKREARRPWLRHPKRGEGLKRAEITSSYDALSELPVSFDFLIQGRRPDKVGTCPWLLYSAPLALFGLLLSFIKSELTTAQHKMIF